MPKEWQIFGELQLYIFFRIICINGEHFRLTRKVIFDLGKKFAYKIQVSSDCKAIVIGDTLIVWTG